MSTFIVFDLFDRKTFSDAGGPIIIADTGSPNSFSLVFAWPIFSLFLFFTFELSILELFRLGVVGNDVFGMLDLLLLCFDGELATVLGLAALFIFTGEEFPVHLPALFTYSILCTLTWLTVEKLKMFGSGFDKSAFLEVFVAFGGSEKPICLKLENKLLSAGSKLIKLGTTLFTEDLYPGF